MSGFLDACRRRPTNRTPIWLMRQAGRYLPEYRDVRARHSFLDVCATPELAAEVTMQPLCRFDLDAAIIFADILLPLRPMGLDVRFPEGAGGGPVVDDPLRTEADLARLRPVEPEEDLAFVMGAIAIVREALGGRLPLIGFAGAPFTLMSYAVEGGPSRDFRRLKALMWNAPELFDRIMDRLAVTTAAYLAAQVRSGAEAVQVFDSWAGALPPIAYRRHVLPRMRPLLQELGGLGVPVIHFAPGVAPDLMAEAGGDVASLDWRSDLGKAFSTLEGKMAVQGNLDPMVLLEGTPEVIAGEARSILEAAAGRPGHIFNLGHGVHRETPISHVEALIDAVHAFVPSPEGGADSVGQG